MKLKEIRESKGISQRQAAIGLNLSPTVYNRYENGTREPSNLVLLAMADYFGVTVDELLGKPALETDDRPKTMEAKIVSFGMDQLPQDERQKILSVLQVMYTNNPKLFKVGGNNEA